MAVGIFSPGKYSKNSTEGEKENVSMFFTVYIYYGSKLLAPIVCFPELVYGLLRQSNMHRMAIRVVKFSSGGYKIRNIFA